MYNVRLVDASRVRVMAKRPKSRASHHEAANQGNRQFPVRTEVSDIQWLRGLETNRLLALLAITLAVLLCYGNTLDNDFIHDDLIEIVGNPFVKDLSHVSQILSTSAWGFGSSNESTVKSNYYRPVQYLSYAIVIKVFGAKAWGFHLVKLTGHLTVCLLLYWIVNSYWKDPKLAFLSAILYATHPANSEAVSWISGITDVSCALFFLLSWVFFLRHRVSNSIADWAGLQLSFLVGLFCKEFMITLIPLLLLFEVLESKRFPKAKALVTTYVPLLLAFATYLAFRIHAIGAFTYESQNSLVFLTRFQSGLNQIVLFSDYIRTYFFPFWLNAFHILRPVLTIWDPRFLGAVAVIGVAGWCCWALAQQLNPARRRLLILGSIWFLVTLSPVLVFFRRIGENAFAERYLYLPDLGISLVVSICLLSFQERYPKISGVIVLIVLLLATRTIARNQVWQDDLAFYGSTLRATPGHPQLLTNLGYAYLQRGRRQEALQMLEESKAKRPSTWQTHENLGRVFREMGRLDEALAAYQQAAILNPARFSLFCDQADILGAKGNFTGAIFAYQKALELESRWEIYFNLAHIYAAAKQFPEAQRSYETAAMLNPSDGRIFAGLGNLHFAQRKYPEAIVAFQRCLGLNPTDLRTWYNLADACLFENRYKEAEAAYQRALSLDSNSPRRAETGIATARARRQSMGQVNGNRPK